MATTTEDYDDDKIIRRELLQKLKSPQCDGQGAVNIAEFLFGQLEAGQLEAAQIERELFQKLKSLQCDGQGAVNIAELLFRRLKAAKNPAPRGYGR